jgi:hypothetical protein
MPPVAGSGLIRPGYGSQSHQQITTQGQITTNHFVSADIINERLAQIAGLKDGDYIPGRIDDHGLNVDAQELVMMRKSEQYPGSNLVAYRTNSFTSFNGLRTFGVRHQDLWEDQFICSGVATSSCDFTGKEPNRSGFATHSAGSITFPNTSGKALNPGDHIRWRAPELDAEKRKEQYFSVDYRRPGDFSTKNKHTATVDRITYTDIAEKFQSHVHYIIYTKTPISIHEFRRRLYHGQMPADGPIAMTSSFFKQFINLIAYHTLILAAQRGYVNPTTSVASGGKITANRPAVTNWLTQTAGFRTSFNAWKDPANWNSTGQTISDQQVLYNMEAWAEVVASSLGLVRPVAGITEDLSFSRLLAIRSLYASLGTHDQPELTRQMIFNEFQTKPDFRLNTLGQVSTYNPNTVKQMQLITGDAAAMFIKSCGQVYDRIYNTALCTVSNPSLPNGPIHGIFH